jgi:hypothetical protein
MRHSLALLLLSLTLPAAAQAGVPHQKNSPISLVRETVSIRTLVDGTHITDKSQDFVYRDSASRVRVELVLTMPYQSGLTLTSHLFTIVDMSTHTATTWQTREGFPDSKTYTRHVMQTGPPAAASAASTAAAQPAPRRTTLEDLGMDSVQGIPCHVVRSRLEYPVGSQGNDKAFTITQESCNSPEFGLLREKSEGPTSVRTMTLQSLTRGEPDPALFQPPTDYTESGQQ